MTDPARLPKYAGSIRAILDSPLDDLPRLVLADMLDEDERDVSCGECDGEGFLIDNRSMFSGTRVGCHACKCDECDGKGDYLHPTHYRQKCKACDGKGGTGRVSNGFAARAEFIRVQCELAGISKGPCSAFMYSCYESGDTCHCNSLRRDALRKRERELWNAIVPFIESAGLVAAPSSPSDGTPLIACLPTGAGPRAYAELTFSRGFVSRVRLPFTAWYGGACENCGGSGRVDGDRWEQSEPCPDCGGEYGPSDEDNPMGVYPGTGAVEGIGPRLCAEHPITSVEIVGKEPYQSEVGGGLHWVWESNNPTFPSVLPACLPRELMIYLSSSEIATSFPNKQAALDALNAACLAWAKSVTEATNTAPAASPQLA